MHKFDDKHRNSFPLLQYKKQCHFSYILFSVSAFTAPLLAAEKEIASKIWSSNSIKSSIYKHWLILYFRYFDFVWVCFNVQSNFSSVYILVLFSWMSRTTIYDRVNILDFNITYLNTWVLWQSEYQYLSNWNNTSFYYIIKWKHLLKGESTHIKLQSYSTNENKWIINVTFSYYRLSQVMFEVTLYS